MLVTRLRNIYSEGEPIFSKDILSLFKEFTRAYVFRLIKNAVLSNKLCLFDRGVYYLPKKTILGNSSITSSIVAKEKYISDSKDVYGIYSGLTLLNQFAITSQVPNVVEIVTNKETTRKRVVKIDGMKFILRKSRFDISKKNYQYYVLLQLFNDIGNNPSLSKTSLKLIKEYIKDNNINRKKLVRYVMAFPAQVLKNLIGSGVIDFDS